MTLHLVQTLQTRSKTIPKSLKILPILAVTDSTIVEVGQATRDWKLLSVQYQGIEEIEKSNDAFIPRITRLESLHSVANLRKPTKSQVEHQENTIKAHRKSEMQEKRIKSRDRDRILHMVYLERIEREKAEAAAIKRKMMQSANSGHLSPLSPTLDSTRSRVVKRSDLHYQVEYTSGPKNGMRISDLVREKGVKGLYWSEYRHGEDQVGPQIPHGKGTNHKTQSDDRIRADGPETPVREKLMLKLRRPVQGISQKLLNGDTAEIPPGITGKLQDLDIQVAKPLKSNDKLNSKLAEAPSSRTPKDRSQVVTTRIPKKRRSKKVGGDFLESEEEEGYMPLHRSKLNSTNSFASKNKRSSSRATMAFGCLIPPMKRLDLDYSDSLWLIFNEQGVY